MKKFLLIPILLIAGAVSASACDTCAAHTHGKAAAKACPADCAKPCCAKKAECAKKKAECAKKAECDKATKAECAKKKAECEKKAAAPAAKKACCPSAK